MLALRRGLLVIGLKWQAPHVLADSQGDVQYHMDEGSPPSLKKFIGQSLVKVHVHKSQRNAESEC